jgi:hypothetical protein
VSIEDGFNQGWDNEGTIGSSQKEDQCFGDGTKVKIPLKNYIPSFVISYLKFPFENQNIPAKVSYVTNILNYYK